MKHWEVHSITDLGIAPNNHFVTQTRSKRFFSLKRAKKYAIKHGAIRINHVMKDKVSGQLKHRGHLYLDPWGIWKPFKTDDPHLVQYGEEPLLI